MKHNSKDIEAMFRRAPTIREGARQLGMCHETYRRRLIEMNLHKPKKNPRLNIIAWRAIMLSVTHKVPASPVYILYELRTQFKQLNAASASLGISASHLSQLYITYGKSWKGFKLTNEEKKIVDRALRKIHPKRGNPRKRKAVDGDNTSG